MRSNDSSLYAASNRALQIRDRICESYLCEGNFEKGKVPMTLNYRRRLGVGKTEILVFLILLLAAAMVGMYLNQKPKAIERDVVVQQQAPPPPPAPVEAPAPIVQTPPPPPPLPKPVVVVAPSPPPPPPPIPESVIIEAKLNDAQDAFARGQTDLEVAKKLSIANSRQTDDYKNATQELNDNEAARKAAIDQLAADNISGSDTEHDETAIRTAAQNLITAKAKILAIEADAIANDPTVADKQKAAKALELKVAELKDELAASGAHSGQPKAANTVLGAVALEVIALSEPHWQEGGIADPQNLGDCLNGVALKLSPFDGTMVAQPTDPSHLTLIIRQVNSGLGEATELPAGKIWIQNGSLMLQWIDKEVSTTAIEKLKYAALETADADGNTVKRFSFLDPVTSSLPLEPDASVKIAIPLPIAAECKLSFATTPSGWDLSEPDKFTEVLRHDPADARLEYDSRSLRVSITCNEINAVDPVHQLAALQTQLATAQRQLEHTKQQYDGSPTEDTTVYSLNSSHFVASPREGLGEEMKQEQEHIDKLQGWIDKAQRDLNANTAAAPAPLEGVVVSLLLPNGIEVARITLGSIDSK